mmetsp:Transcript_57270/g.91061  ORF Transcript_57270/g.91061 Transcript_57270/m.91061 type:complete len:97 (-) Transcript_57270:33-323(-)
MQMLRTAVVALVIACVTAKGNLRERHEAKSVPTAMAGLEGEACGAAEYKRYQTIVCTVEETCKCADTQCALDWCADYVHTWKMEFGACTLKGCPSA